MSRQWTGGECPIECEYTSPRISGEVYECALPLTFDQYSRCSYECVYCFAQFQKQINAGSKKGEVALSQYDKPITCVDPEAIKRVWLSLDRIASQGGALAMIRNLIQRHAPVHWGGLADPFDGTEERYRVGLELIRFWRSLNYPVVFSTKSDLFTRDPWREALDHGNFRFQQSIITPDQKKADIVDQGCPTVDARFAAMRVLTKEMGLVVTLRLRPIIPGVVSPAECMALVKRARECGATGISTEFFCMEGRGLNNRWRYAKMSEVAGFDLYEYYRRQSPKQSGYLRLNPEVKRAYFEPMAAFAKKHKMRFAISDLHFKYLNTCVGCCAVYSDGETATPAEGDQTKPWLNRGTLTWAIQQARDNGEVRRCEVDQWLNWASSPMNSAVQGFCNNPVARSKRRNQSVADVLREQWNDPNNAHSPVKYTYGLLEPAGMDDNGDVIYRYRKDKE
jgi:DNA repair photolyase